MGDYLAGNLVADSGVMKAVVWVEQTVADLVGDSDSLSVEMLVVSRDYYWVAKTDDSRAGNLVADLVGKLVVAMAVLWVVAIAVTKAFWTAVRKVLS